MTNIVVQASSRNWGGGVEHCMNEVDGYPAIYWTIKRIYDNFENVNVIIAAPEYDAQGELNQLKKHFKKLTIIYSHNSSPLLRMIEATKNLENTHFLRVNGLNFLFDIDFFKDIYQFAIDGNYDCVKFSDDYPVHFTCEMYKSSALLKLNEILSSGEIDTPNIHEVHPKFLLMRTSTFKSQYYYPSEQLNIKNIQRYREIMKQVMFSERQDVSDSQKIPSGDQLSYHYDLADHFLAKKQLSSGNILDIACGTGHGTKRFSGKGFEIVGADYDKNQIKNNQIKLANHKDIKFMREDIMNMSFVDNSFDVALSMETLEHVEPHAALKELQRVIKKNGYLILSTPQNLCSSICVNPHHLYEYSLQETTDLVSNYFTIERVIGLKAGKIHFDDDPIGANTIIFARND